MKPSLQYLVAVTAPAALLGFPFTSAAYAQAGTHPTHPGGASLSRLELLSALAHGLTQGSMVFLVGLVAFAALVWLPVSRTEEVDWEKAASLLSRSAWVLAGLLLVAGMLELPVYAVRASGESLSPGLLGEALVDTRVGHIWLARLGLAFLTALAASWAFREGGSSLWATIGVGSVLLVTLSLQSHAAAEDHLLAFACDWLHLMAASVWVGGLLGFPLLLLGPLRAMPAEARSKLLRRTVRRFSRVATVAVMAIVVTGVYAILLHVPNFSAVIGTPYGRALVMKLGMVALMLPIGAINLIDRGRDPFDRMVGAELLLAFGVFVATGFLTSLPPPGP